MVKMDKDRISTSLSAATIMNKVTTYHPHPGDCAKRAVQTACTEVARAVQGTVRIFKIIIFLHSAKDFPSILRLYAIEDSNSRQSPDEMCF
ncbi:MAG: hypothetical protein ABSF24_03170 [Candidatus Bathyarchaeia archaeon]